MHLAGVSEKMKPEVIRPPGLFGGHVCSHGGGQPEIRRPAFGEKKRGSETTCCPRFHPPPLKTQLQLSSSCTGRSLLISFFIWLTLLGSSHLSLSSGCPHTAHSKIQVQVGGLLENNDRGVGPETGKGRQSIRNFLGQATTVSSNLLEPV